MRTVLKPSSPAFRHMRPIYLLTFSALVSFAAQADPAHFPAGSVQCEEEADCLQQLKGIASRSGDQLRLKLGNGRTKVRQGNRKACEAGDAEKCMSYELRAYHPTLHTYVLDLGAWEGRAAELVDANTGQSMLLDTLPHYSPSGRWLVSTNDSEMSRDYDVAIWSTTAGLPKQELRYSAPETEFMEYWEFAGWDGDERIKFKVNFMSGGETTAFETDAVLTGDSWKLNRPEPRR
ncbi:hypothetical protein [Microvirga rosea]|uniref:hypothetical protein n=1 Tax=Microvirga rosea TaxID=2715425 RepID=UPI001D0A57EA|nr:hypothetical protein [Microvirga rosea]MCB8823161.1 hypothetical protein [Microvirga rosea]